VNPLDPALLGVAWLHSREEDAGAELVFRPEHFPFPPARRPRDGFVLAPGGAATALTGGPDDRAAGTPAAWTEGPNGVELALGGRTLLLVSADSERIVARVA
jgi:hypothetical protein